MQIRNTDDDWRKLGDTNPYFAVLTQPQFDISRLEAAALEEFFRGGEEHVNAIFGTIRRCFDANFRPRLALDFGCGVGRILTPMSLLCDQAIGVDISEGMLARARKHLDERGIRNVDLVLSDDTLSRVPSGYDFFNSVIVFQHIPPPRGYRILDQLAQRLASGGCFYLQLTFAKDRRFLEHATDHLDLFRTDEQGIHLLAERPLHEEGIISMYDYDLNQVFIILQTTGVTQIFSQFTDHGGCRGIIIYGQKG